MTDEQATHLEREINEQPGVIRSLLANEQEHIQQIAAAIRDFNPTFVQIAARGTSDNAARYAQYLWGVYTRLPVMLATPSLHTLYQAPPKLDRALVIGISQSGKAEDVRQVLSDANEQGALTLSITNNPDSPLAQTAAHHIYLNAGDEISIAATKTYTAQLTAIAMLASALSEDAKLHADLQQLPTWVEQTLQHAESVKGWVQRYRYAEHFVSVGRGYNYATAFEISLKVKELCYTTGSGYSEADFRHGPIAIVDRGFPVLVIAPTGKTLPGVREILDQLCKREAESIVISDDGGLLEKGTVSVALPTLPEPLSPVVAVIPGQVFAMRLALAKNHPVDQPRGLNKVTVTR